VIAFLVEVYIGIFAVMKRTANCCRLLFRKEEDIFRRHAC
jgi:hypothetical protein